MAAGRTNRGNILRSDWLFVQKNREYRYFEGHRRAIRVVPRAAIDEGRSGVLFWPRAAPAQRNRLRLAHQRENHGDQESGNCAFGNRALLAAARKIASPL